MQPSMKNKLCVATATLAVGCSVSYIFYKLRKRLRDAADLFKYLTINTVTTEESCDQVVEELRRRCQKHRALGFDCEWVTENGKRQPVALLQLSSYDGYCGLFRLHMLKTIPPSLKDLLDDEKIYKVGVAPQDDGKYLSHDYGVTLRSTLDIRHLAKLNGFQAGGLATLSSALLGAVLDKSWRVRCSDWQAAELTERQVKYAAIDAHVAIRIFAILLEKLGQKETVLSWVFGSSNPSVWADLDDHCSKFADKHYKTKQVKLKDGAKDDKVRVRNPLGPSKKYANPTRQKPMYHNGFLYAPGGDFLCTCDRKKAMWFVNKGLADLVQEEPASAQLRYEPAGRTAADVARYYQLEKENKCVVCGESNTYIRKNVVPREYRKIFPDVMKEHASHDVVLLCARCHQMSNIQDFAVRERLAESCNAPLPTDIRGKKTYEDPARRKIRSCGRALMYLSHKLPESRQKELEDFLLQHYTTYKEVNEELLKEACEIQVVFVNVDYQSHGTKVVDYYLKNGGLLSLERMWREHFLKTMKPKYMPALWSITHNEEKLRAKWKEGRITEADLKSIGLTTL